MFDVSVPVEVVSRCFRFGEQHEALKGPVFALEPHQEPESSWS